MIITIPPGGERASAVLPARDEVVRYTLKVRSESGIGYEETELTNTVKDQTLTPGVGGWAKNVFDARRSYS